MNQWKPEWVDQKEKFEWITKKGYRRLMSKIATEEQWAIREQKRKEVPDKGDPYIPPRERQMVGFKMRQSNSTFVRAKAKERIIVGDTHWRPRLPERKGEKGDEEELGEEETSSEW